MGEGGGGGGAERGGYIFVCVCVGGGGSRGEVTYLWGVKGAEVTFCGEGGHGCFVGVGGWGVSNCTVTQQGCLKNQQSKVLSVLPTVMANSSIASQRGGDRSRQILQWIGKGPRG